MADANLKNKGLLLQLAGFIVLLVSLNGFFVLKETALYFPGIIVGVIIFAACLFRGGSLVKRSKEQKG
jgi:hypothetical protein